MVKKELKKLMHLLSYTSLYGTSLATGLCYTFFWWTNTVVNREALLFTGVILLVSFIVHIAYCVNQQIMPIGQKEK